MLTCRVHGRQAGIPGCSLMPQLFLDWHSVKRWLWGASDCCSTCLKLQAYQGHTRLLANRVISIPILSWVQAACCGQYWVPHCVLRCHDGSVLLNIMQLSTPNVRTCTCISCAWTSWQGPS